MDAPAQIYAPPVLLFFNLQVFYLIVMAVFGSLKGIVQLNLGSISTFQASTPGLGAPRHAPLLFLARSSRLLCFFLCSLAYSYAA